MTGKWWLVSWTTYGTWLPGDTRGFCTFRGERYISPPKRYAKPGEATYQSQKYTDLHALAESICDDPVRFTRDEIQIAFAAMVDEIAQIQVVPAIMSLGPWHVHWLCYFGTLKIRTIVGRVKAAATRELNLHGFSAKRPWAKGCNIRSKSDRSACRNAYKYIRNHRDQGCLIYEWPIDPKFLEF